MTKIIINIIEWIIKSNMIKISSQYDKIYTTLWVSLVSRCISTLVRSRCSYRSDVTQFRVRIRMHASVFQYTCARGCWFSNRFSTLYFIFHLVSFSSVQDESRSKEYFFNSFWRGSGSIVARSTNDESHAFYSSGSLS